MIEVHQTDVFRDWLERLRDLRQDNPRAYLG